MDPKYSNIFWHQGVKVFTEEELKSINRCLRIEHLENDVTKSLINVLQYCSAPVLKAFLHQLHVTDHPDAFLFDFQVTDTKKYRKRKNRIMLSIVSAGTKIIPLSDNPSGRSIPDACIYSGSTAILIEAKTQSPLDMGQIALHIKNYLGTATKESIITWEDVGEVLYENGKKLGVLDRFLTDQFHEFLGLIGISAFSGFSEVDFSMLGALGKIPDEDFLDFKRMFHRKVSKFMGLLEDSVKPISTSKNTDIYVSQRPTASSGTYSGFYFHDNSPQTHINHYPNFNIEYTDRGMELSINAETRPSVKRLLWLFDSQSKALEDFLAKHPETYVVAYYKLQYRPMDYFVWNLVPGFPISADNLNHTDPHNLISEFEQRWGDFKTTVLFTMRSGAILLPSGRPFNEQELKFAEQKNSRPNFGIRIGRLYPVTQIVQAQIKVVKLMAGAIGDLEPIAQILLDR